MSMIPQTSAMYSSTLQDELAEYDGGEAFMKRIDRILPQVEDATLMRLESKLENMKLPEGMKRETELKLWVLSQKLSEVLKNKAQSQTLSDAEVKKVEADILAMQQSFLRELEASMSQLISEIATSVGTREQGSMSGEFFYSIPYFWEITMEVSLEEYTADTESLDRVRLQGDIAFSLEMEQESVKSSMEIDLIVDGSDIYILVQDLSLEGEVNQCFEIQSKS